MMIPPRGGYLWFYMTMGDLLATRFALMHEDENHSTVVRDFFIDIV
ncbi:MAG: hypothetical protein IPM54_03665 [Polyangiaceae bacterium]|nr:hypothetical protein [Polyangiaceae bacterium]